MSTSGEETRRALRIYQVDAFTATKFAGNPAAVVSEADALSSDEMQAIAREMNCSETAFLLSPVADDHDIWVRYFTLTSEVPICGHGTTAAHYACHDDRGGSTNHRKRRCSRHFASGANGIRTRDLLLAKSQRADSAAGQ